MNVVFYTNCQSRGIQYFLDIYYRECGVSVTFEHIENFTLIESQGAIDYDLLRSADIFIYQPIAARHGLYSTSSEVEGNILSSLKPGTRVVSIPYIYNSALWCMIPPATIDNLVGGFGVDGEYINREVLDRLFDAGVSLKEVLKRFKRREIDFQYEKRFQASLSILRQKESACSVKVADFIEANIRTRRLFYTQNHPTTCVFVHCVNQVLEALGFEHSFDAKDYPENIGEFSKGWPHSTSDLKDWQFEFPIPRVDNSFYRKHITRIYESHKRRRVYPLSFSVPDGGVGDSKEQKKTGLSPQNFEEQSVCRQAALYMLDKIGLITAQNVANEVSRLRVLMLSVGTLTDHREFLSVGFRDALGVRFVDCRGVDRSEIKKQIKRGDFDLVIFANLDIDRKLNVWTIPYLRLAREWCGRNSAAFGFGGDYSADVINERLSPLLESGHCFVCEPEKHD